MIVAGIDPSLTSAGVAILTNGQPAHTSHHGFDGTDAANYQIRNRRGRWTARQIRDAAVCCGRPDLVMIEGLPPHTPGANRDDRAYLFGKVFEAFDWPEIPIAVVNPQLLKAWVTGKGSTREPGLTKYQRKKRDKQLIVSTIESWWPQWTFANDDECDGAGLAAMGAHHLGEPMPFELKPRHTTGLEAVQWPTT